MVTSGQISQGPSPNNALSTPAGNIRRYFKNWEKKTSNSFILNILRCGYKIQFIKPVPNASIKKILSKPSKLKLVPIINEIQKYVKNSVVSVVEPLESDIVSRIFSVPKPNGNIRLVIDLSNLNNYVNKIPFKIEDQNDIKNMITQGDFLASIDIKDAFFSVPLHESSKRFTCFEINNTRFSYNVLPFGLTSSPRIFSKIFKVVISYLRTKGIKISAYLDDIIIIGESFERVENDLITTLYTLKKLGYIVNFEKSLLTPSQKISHLGFIWDSTDMTVSLPVEKIDKIQKIARRLFIKKLIPIRDLSSILGLFVSSSTGFKFAALVYRKLQFDIIKAISSSDSWEDLWSLSNEALEDLEWWCLAERLDFIPVSIKEENFHVTLFTDSSKTGWGAHLSNGLITSGKWSKEESLEHINFLELKAVILSIEEFLPSLREKNVLIRCDNSTVVFYINKFGGTKSKKLCYLTLNLWKTLRNNSIMCKASHISGFNTKLADYLSRFSHNHEYSLKTEAFSFINSCLSFELELDIFASKENKKLPSYVTLFPDPMAIKTDAFSFKWECNLYCFPPIPLISKALQKIFRDNVSYCLFITPAWNTLNVIPILKQSLIDIPILIPYTHILGSLPTRKPFYLMGWPISSCTAKKRVFHQKLLKLSSKASVNLPLNHIRGTGKDLVIGLIKMNIPLKCVPM